MLYEGRFMLRGIKKLCCLRSVTKPKASLVGGGPRLQGFATGLLGLVLVMGCFAPALRLAGAPQSPVSDKRDPNPGLQSTGPTLHLGDGRRGSPGNTVSEFMYFVPLVSLEPVTIVKSPGNTQRVRMLSNKRSFSSGSFVVTCEYEFNGEGNQRNVFDHSEKIRRHERELKEGGLLDHQLSSINIEGAGRLRLEVEGTMAGNVPTVTEVRLRFNCGGQPSLVSIGLHDIGYSDGDMRVRNEINARVNTLTFRRKPGPPKMDITVAAVKRKGAGNNFVQNVMGGLKATAANMVLKPVAVDAAGNEAMLNFGLALVSKAPSFTFPNASNLKATGLLTSARTDQ
jgi:hypothetical protein